MIYFSLGYEFDKGAVLYLYKRIYKTLDEILKDIETNPEKVIRESFEEHYELIETIQLKP